MPPQRAQHGPIAVVQQAVSGTVCCERPSDAPLLLFPCSRKEKPPGQRQGWGAGSGCRDLTALCVLGAHAVLQGVAAALCVDPHTAVFLWAVLCFSCDPGSTFGCVLLLLWGCAIRSTAHAKTKPLKQ